MKYLLPVAAILILGVCVQLRRGEREIAHPAPDRQPPVVLTEGAKAESAQPLPPRVEPVRETVAEIPKAKPRTATAPVLSASSQGMHFALREELQLTEQQSERVSAALEARDRELQDCHEAIRKSGVFVPGEYGKTLMRMKDGWFRSIDQVLDSRQHAKFEALVAGGFLRPGTEFTANLDETTIVHDR